MCGHCLGKCWAAADGVHNLTIWMVIHRCTELCDSPAQFSSRIIVLVSKPVCCLLNALLK